MTGKKLITFHFGYIVNLYAIKISPIPMNKYVKSLIIVLFHIFTFYKWIKCKIDVKCYVWLNYFYLSSYFHSIMYFYYLKIIFQWPHYLLELVNITLLFLGQFWVAFNFRLPKFYKFPMFNITCSIRALFYCLILYPQKVKCYHITIVVKTYLCWLGV